MNFWERHRPAVIVAGAFLVAWFFLWVFLLRGVAKDYAFASRALAGAIATRKENFSGTEGHSDSAPSLTRRFTAANAALAAAYETEKARRLYVFTLPVTPPAWQSPTFFLVENMKAMEAVWKTQVAGECGIGKAEGIVYEAEMSPPKSLGLDIPWSPDAITPGNVETRMRQFEVVGRFRDLLAATHRRVVAEGSGEPDARRAQPVESLLEFNANLDPATVGALRYYPLKVKLRMTWPALVALLELCDAPDPKMFHVVREMAVAAATDAEAGDTAETRHSRLEIRPGDPHQTVDEARRQRVTREMRRYLNYFDVTLTLATLAEAQDPVAVAPPPRPGGDQQPGSGGGSGSGTVAIGRH